MLSPSKPYRWALIDIPDLDMAFSWKIVSRGLPIFPTHGSGGSSSSSSSSSFVSFVHSGRGSTALWRIVRAGVVPGAVRAALWLPRHTTCIICGVVLQLARSL